MASLATPETLEDQAMYLCYLSIPANRKQSTSVLGLIAVFIGQNGVSDVCADRPYLNNRHK